MRVIIINSSNNSLVCRLFKFVDYFFSVFSFFFNREISLNEKKAVKVVLEDRL